LPDVGPAAQEVERPTRPHCNGRAGNWRRQAQFLVKSLRIGPEQTAIRNSAAVISAVSGAIPDCKVASSRLAKEHHVVARYLRDNGDQRSVARGNCRLGVVSRGLEQPPILAEQVNFPEGIVP
jgi:hypothetical protein